MYQEKEVFTDDRYEPYVELGYWIDYKKRSFTRNKFMYLKDVESFVRSRHHFGIFQTAYKYDGATIEDSNLTGDLYFDFDADDDFELARRDAITTVSFFKTVFKLEERDLKIFFSGKKGIHILVPANILGIEKHPELNDIFKTIAKHVQGFLKNKTLDLVIYDNKRLLRIPNTIHEKSGYYKIQITSDELRHMPEQEIKNLAQQPRYLEQRFPAFSPFAHTQYKRYVEQMVKEKRELEKEMKKRGNQKLDYTPPCIEYILENGAEKGARNNTLAALASFKKAQGISLEEALVELSEWNSTKNNPMIHPRELEKTIRSIYAGYRNYGCSRLKELSVCNIEECRLKRKTVNENERRNG